MQKDNTRGIYIHIPFCMSKCPYCDFYSVPGANTGKIEAFAAALAAAARWMHQCSLAAEGQAKVLQAQHDA